ncbi:hypothetical protein L873DRAFT_1814190 [Choiromyces venosus 120613-1]|uniref:Uncharacterized protein n=1 Tax=Choiromyces venosus 120613-1 TaxID=1336337 RepID=A0A3N4JDV5_9PEZI|nr:hypothetical protein L873DRAFT_1814190 [Choiromyces venosus 120613-1]
MFIRLAVGLAPCRANPVQATPPNLRTNPSSLPALLPLSLVTDNRILLHPHICRANISGSAPGYRFLGLAGYSLIGFFEGVSRHRQGVETD